MKTVETIDREIKSLEDQLSGVTGRKTEIYARIVGYYRSLTNWNKGKKSEYSQRLHFKTPQSYIEESIEKTYHAEEAPVEEDRRKDVTQDEIASYLYFFRSTCPRCKPVKTFLAGLGIEGRGINVDSDEGMKEAAAHQILATPTVIFYDRDGNSIGRGTEIEKLQSFFASAPASR
jgi:ribonucleoside-triphosphate reductase